MSNNQVCRKKVSLTDYSHQRPRMKQVEPKPDKRHQQEYYGVTTTSVTSYVHLPTPSHAYHPSLKDAPPPYYGLRKTNVTDWLESKVKRFNPKDNFYHPVSTTDVTAMLRFPIPSHPSKDAVSLPWHGRTKTFITDPCVDDFTDANAAAAASRELRDKEGKYKPPPCTLGKSKAAAASAAECSS